MTFQPAAHAALVELFWEGQGAIAWQNNLHFTKTDFNDDDMDDLALAVVATPVGHAILPFISSDITLASYRVTDLRTQGARQFGGAIAVAGTSASDASAQGAALIATLRTDLRGRSFRGRFYMGGISEDDILDGEYTAGSSAALISLLQDFLDNALLVGWALVVLSRQNLGVEREVAVGTEVSDLVVRSKLPGSQRRRNRRP